MTPGRGPDGVEKVDFVVNVPTLTLCHGVSSKGPGPYHDPLRNLRPVRLSIGRTDRQVPPVYSLPTPVPGETTVPRQSPTMDRDGDRLTNTITVVRIGGTDSTTNETHTTSLNPRPTDSLLRIDVGVLRTRTGLSEERCYGYHPQVYPVVEESGARDVFSSKSRRPGV